MTDSESVLHEYEREMLNDDVIGDYYAVKVRWVIKDSDDSITTLLPVIFTSVEEGKVFLKDFRDGDSEVTRLVEAWVSSGDLPLPPNRYYRPLMASVVPIAVVPF